MENKKTQQADILTSSFGVSAAISILFNTILVMLKESIPALNAFMKSLTSHHWISHGLFVVFLFLILGLVFNKIKIQLTTIKLIGLILISSVVSATGIVVWFMLY